MNITGHNLFCNNFSIFINKLPSVKDKQGKLLLLGNLMLSFLMVSLMKRIL